MNHGPDITAPTPPGAPASLSVKVERDRETAKLIPAGEIDLASVGQLQSELETLIDANFALIVIDLQEVEFLDSAGIHALVCAHARAQDDGWQLAIIPGPRTVHRLFEITGLVDHLPFAVDGASRSQASFPTG